MRTVEKKKKKRPAGKTTYDVFMDEFGFPLYRQCITRYPDGDKIAPQQRYEDGKWKWGLKENDRLLVRRVLYNLPELCGYRNKLDKIIWIVEGAKCANYLIELGLLATCTMMGTTGANPSQWRRVYNTYLKGHTIYILADNDDVGYEYARNITKYLFSEAKEIRIITPWKDKPKGYDVADWIDEHPKASKKWLVKQLKKFAEQSSVYTLQDSLPYRTYNLTEVENFKNPEFQIDKILPAGCLAILFSPAKTYKSFLALSWAAAIQTGNSWLNSYNTKQGQVVYVIAEGGQGDWKLRIKALQKGYRQAKTKEQLNKMCVIFGQPLLDTKDTTKLIEVLETIEPSPTLVVLDTKARTLSGSELSGQDLGLYIHGVDRIREQFGCSVLIVDHTPLSDVTRIRGHSALTGAADMLIRIEKPKEDSGLAKIICEDARSCEKFEDIYIELISERMGGSLTSLRVVGGNRSEWKSEKIKAIDRNVELVMKVLAKQPGLNSKKLKEETGLKRVFYDVIKYMAENDLVENRGTESRPKWHLLQ